MRNILLTLVMVPFWTSFLIRTYAWITILSKEGLLNAFLVLAKIVPEPIGILYTPFASVLGLVYNYLPFMIFLYTRASSAWIMHSSKPPTTWELGCCGCSRKSSFRSPSPAS